MESRTCIGEPWRALCKGSASSHLHAGGPKGAGFFDREGSIDGILILESVLQSFADRGTGALKGPWV